ncbi:hypothetical protein QA600_13660 [Natronococcus sp. A-GB1]|uniref:hypothetical protein n=1 Tax=Natronococcus sp. A-GB1 TaxID=3037648 RepID=UPI00241C45A6|nr:hypothetical protein [Natronococcus sp. A-GB1]MDG5760383.1 hypothetical protein [Natronococcus sp. A-GB1]
MVERDVHPFALEIGDRVLGDAVLPGGDLRRQVGQRPLRPLQQRIAEVPATGVAKCLVDVI